nr:sulfurtransferase [Naasia aerilata]
MPPVVSPSWLAEHRSEVVLADVRWYLDGRSSRGAYDAGHIPGAVFVELEERLSGPSSDAAGRHPLPDPIDFADGMAALGIGDGDVVIAYDDEGGVIAARLVWMLRALGHEAAFLDGGIQSYPGALEPDPVRRPAATFTAAPWPREHIAQLEELRATEEQPGVEDVVIDARNGDRYRGENEPVDPRAGHIPGAVSVPCRENLDEHGRLLPREVLRERFERVGVREGTPVISYCGSGVTATHNLLTLEYAGFGPGRLYPGSWSQYSRTELPIETGTP